MQISEQFWQASIQELKKGYIEEQDHFTCLLCGTHIEKGVIYPHHDLLYDAKKYMRIHIEQSHQSVFDYLLKMDRKLTGITEHQKRLLQLFYLGKNDKEIQTELEIGSSSTIRHHRFALKEKERQARNFLAMMELLREKDQHSPQFAPVHPTATMVDDRYNVTKAEKIKIIDKFFPEGVANGLHNFPPKEKQRMIILGEIAKQLDTDYRYSENEFNESLKQYYHDYVKIRRYLIEYGFISRKPDGSEYWLTKDTKE
ncbi:DUF2087 domain-containing protein [Gracilibacillus caseinilyticus]|uniref:DUF2087 domain-containing protein n=1 Tax=Gracilibacillus caseinilyticus TaxID=2932256 RepID=A0ABY4F160_9BACI|nr:DUF2087 domain-containing protein [Gracilibacillus caseinilyticus]UOQ49902.1 DUF2087 domain-containing protein [Gracilibacillus caseinilyticus]